VKERAEQDPARPDGWTEVTEYSELGSLLKEHEMIVHGNMIDSPQNTWCISQSSDWSSKPAHCGFVSNIGFRRLDNQVSLRAASNTNNPHQISQTCHKQLLP